LIKVLCNKGIAQGDLDSCLRYIIFKDLTLISLQDDPRREKIYIRGSAGLIHEVMDLCYADDLVTFSGTIAGQQRKADIIGALTQIFNLKINVAKLRTAASNFGNEQTIPTNSYLTINDGSEKSTNVPSPKETEFKQLGFTRTISANRRVCDLSQFKQVKQIITVMCNTIQRKKASSATKLLTVQLKLFTKVRYLINSSSWTLAQLRELDVPINKIYRHSSKNMHTFPNELLYSNAPGLNFEQLSDSGILSKFSLLLRGMKYENSINQYIHGFFHRAARFCGLSLCRGEAFTLQHNPHHHYFLSAILERLAECKLYLAIGGIDVAGTTQEQILNQTPKDFKTVYSRQNLITLTKLNIHTVGDIITVSMHKNQWFGEATLTKLGLDFLLPHIRREVPIGQTLLRQQSCWIRPEHNDILEYLGQIPITGSKKLGLMFRQWNTIKMESFSKQRRYSLV